MRWLMIAGGISWWIACEYLRGRPSLAGIPRTLLLLFGPVGALVFFILSVVLF
jgi:hypothetical protein